MNYLLDTHTFIWAISERKKLSANVLNELDNNDNSIFVSAISFWEIALKFSIGKLQIAGSLPENLPELALKTGFQLIPLSADESASHYKLNLTTHKDPFDRMLVWQAIQRNLVLISKDNRVAQYGPAGLKIFW